MLGEDENFIESNGFEEELIKLNEDWSEKLVKGAELVALVDYNERRFISHAQNILT